MAAPGFCEVAVPLPLPQTFTYNIPERLVGQVCPGSRVLVPFQKRKLTGMVVALEETSAGVQGMREVAEVLDEEPLLGPTLMRLGRWMADYYLAPPGEVFFTMLPLGRAVHQVERVRLTEAGHERVKALAQKLALSEDEMEERNILSRLTDGRSRRLDGLTRRSKQGRRVVERLVRTGAIEIAEEIRRRSERTRLMVALKPNVWKEVGRARPSETRVLEFLKTQKEPVALARLIKQAGVSRPTIRSLLNRGLLESREQSREYVVAEGFDFEPPSNVLNRDQETVLRQIQTWLAAREFKTALVHGVTGSGKTEVYLGAIESCLEQDRGALLLVPEIALTPAVAALFRSRFGNHVAILHSGLGEWERSREWWRIRRGQARVVVGTRSAVFAPLENLGLIIVDEEQETSYKQEETPKYNGRDVAVMRGKFEGAVVVLGSATPALESFYHARAGKYQLLSLESRVENRPLARVEIVDMRREFEETHQTRPLSRRLRDEISAALERGEQVLVLLNRRGYAMFVLCRHCGATVQCGNCSISLTYHKARGRLLCHYCGYSRAMPARCLKCQSEHLYSVGEGAEKVEEYLKAEFRTARIARLDRDTATGRRRYHEILGAFSSGQIDILVGTQMIAKGHDFHRVTVVGVVSADIALGLPDLRAAERTFQLLTQVAGRAGRGPLPGRVIVQTYYPDHYAIQFAAQQDYAGFFERELRFRRLMHYPPFSALANLIVRGRKLEDATRVARTVGRFLAASSARELKVLGPAAAPIARLKGEYRFQFLLKSPRRGVLHEALKGLLAYCREKQIPSSQILIDVDPLSLM